MHRDDIIVMKIRNSYSSHRRVCMHL